MDKEKAKKNLRDMGFVTEDDLEDFATKEDIQEAVEISPEDLKVENEEEEENEEETYECGACGYTFDSKSKHCPDCGVELEW